MMVDKKGHKCRNIQEQVKKNKDDIKDLQERMPVADFVIHASVEDENGKHLKIRQRVDDEIEEITFKGGKDLIAGPNINITETDTSATISATTEPVGSVSFENVVGDAMDNDNLKGYLNKKQTKLTAGSNITITEYPNTAIISADFEPLTDVVTLSTGQNITGFKTFVNDNGISIGGSTTPINRRTFVKTGELVFYVGGVENHLFYNEIANQQYVTNYVASAIAGKQDKATLGDDVEALGFIRETAHYIVSQSVSNHTLTWKYNDDITGSTYIPYKTSDLTNDSGFITISDVPTTIAWNNVTGKPTFSTVATTGSYNDLTNKPTIPTKTSELDNDANFAYQDEIPTKTSELQNDSGFVDEDYHDTTKQNTLVSGTNIKTINGTSVLGAGNIQISGEPDAYLKSASVSGNTLTLTNKDGTTVAFTPTGQEGGITDVQVNNTSVVEDGVAYIEIPEDAQIVYDMTLNLQTGTVTINSPNYYSRIVQYHTDYEKWPVIYGVVHITGQPDIIVLIRSIVDNGNALVMTGTYDQYGTDISFDVIEVTTTSSTQIGVFTSKEIAQKSDIPTAVSELDNDSGFITSASVPTALSSFTNDVGYITLNEIPDVAWDDVKGKPTFATVATTGSYNDLTNKPTIPTVPTVVSAFTNDVGYITANDIPAIPTKTSDLTNDSGFITSADIPTTIAWSNVTGKPFSTLGNGLRLDGTALTFDPMVIASVEYTENRLDTKQDISTLDTDIQALGFIKSISMSDIADILEGSDFISVDEDSETEKLQISFDFTNLDEFITFPTTQSEVVLSWTSDSPAKLQATLNQTVRNKINNSLQLPTTHTEETLVGVDTTGAQEQIKIGSGLSVVNGSLTATAQEVHLYEHNIEFSSGSGIIVQHLNLTLITNTNTQLSISDIKSIIGTTERVANGFVAQTTPPLNTGSVLCIYVDSNALSACILKNETYVAVSLENSNITDTIRQII